MLGLYDQRGMLRYAGPGRAECLAYADLFGLSEESFSLEPLNAEMSALDLLLQGPLAAQAPD